jgi:hypothetical protein
MSGRVYKGWVFVKERWWVVLSRLPAPLCLVCRIIYSPRFLWEAALWGWRGNFGAGRWMR